MGSGEHKNYNPDSQAARIDIEPISIYPRSGRNVGSVSIRAALSGCSPELEAGYGVNEIWL